MKTIKFLSKTLFLMFISTLSFSCNNDDDNPQQPQFEYFVKEVTVWEGDNENMKISFQYDLNNRIIEQRINTDTIWYAYNELGQMSRYRVNDELSHSFVYQNKTITKILEHSVQTGEVVEEIPVTFSNGAYSIHDKVVCKVDEQGQLLELPEEGIVFIYGEESGVHRNLTLNPARYFLYGGEFALYDLTLSNKELLAWEQEGSKVSLNNQRNDQGLITTMTVTTIYGKNFQWDIKYEERELVR